MKREKYARVSFGEQGESNVILGTCNKFITTDDSTPVTTLTVLKRTLRHLSVQIINDNGCNMNIVLKGLVNRTNISFSCNLKICVPAFERRCKRGDDKKIIIEL